MSGPASKQHAKAIDTRTEPSPSRRVVHDRVLIVDDDKIIVDSLQELLRVEGYDVDGVYSVKAAVEMLDRQRYAILITDVNMPEADGFELLNLCRDRHGDVARIVITGYGTIESAVEAIRMGAYDYLTKPIDDDELRLTLQRALQHHALKRENSALRDQLDMRYALDSVIGHDYKMLKIFDLVDAVAETKTTVLITGESGTGKSLVAHAIHHRSDRANQPFVEVSCGAIPEGLLESELFGHVKGSFTGAVSDKEGKFKAAEGGTLFLDEINSASPAFQVKLLRILQEKCYEPVGSNETAKANVRVILASNVDLQEEITAGRFRQDLYYRINVVTIPMPPLVDRLGDIPLLAKRFLKQYRAEVGREILDFSPESLHVLQAYHWPGNVRELENAVERAVVMCKERIIRPEHLPAAILADAPPASTSHPGTSSEAEEPSMPLKKAMEEPERRIIEAALKAHNWNRQATAEALQINRTTLYKKMKYYGLEFDPAMHGGEETSKRRNVETSK